MAIKTIVFDLGGVLYDFNPQRMLDTHFDKKHHALINEKIFASAEWKQMDRGVYEVDEAIELMCRDLPAEFHPEIQKMILERDIEMPPITEMHSVVKALKENGYNIYLLSNCPTWFGEFRKNKPVFDFFDGFIISAEYNLIKPEREIYEVLFEKFSLTPSECFFIDDSPANIATALTLGMQAHCFQDRSIEKLKTALKNAGVKF